MKLSTLGVSFFLEKTLRLNSTRSRESFRVTQAWDRQVTDKEYEELKWDAQNCRAKYTWIPVSYHTLIAIWYNFWIFLLDFSKIVSFFIFHFSSECPVCCRHSSEGIEVEVARTRNYVAMLIISRWLRCADPRFVPRETQRDLCNMMLNDVKRRKMWTAWKGLTCPYVALQCITHFFA